MLAIVTARVLHLAATCTSLGGLVYARVILWPAVATLPAEARGPFLKNVIRRYAYVKWTGVAVVAATGVFGLLRVLPTVPARSAGAYLAAFALKMFGAVGLFTITAQLALPLPAFRGVRRRRALWSAVNIACGLLILIGAALMRSIRTG
jgi:uncharacterized membrane protein